jgi:hypothetical protein
LVFTVFLSFAPIFVFFAPFLVYESSPLIINIKEEEKIGRFGSVAGGARFGRQ